MPGVKINYKLSNNTKKMLAHGINQCKKLLKEAGAENVIAFGPVRNTGWHLVGTAKMGKSKKNSVVNKFGQSHDINNLFIIDSSIFPSSSGVNIASTTQAVSLMISDHIKKNKKINYQMSTKSNKGLLMKNNLRLILNYMIPGDNYMPSFTKSSTN